MSFDPRLLNRGAEPTCLDLVSSSPVGEGGGRELDAEHRGPEIAVSFDYADPVAYALQFGNVITAIGMGIRVRVKG